jgi:hypothetical protein
MSSGQLAFNLLQLSIKYLTSVLTEFVFDASVKALIFDDVLIPMHALEPTSPDFLWQKKASF